MSCAENIYIGQTHLEINVYLGASIVGQQTSIIKYRKPDDTTGQWAATVVDEEKGHLRFTPTSITDLDQAGTWTAWGHVTFADSTVIAGTPDTFVVKAEGT